MGKKVNYLHKCDNSLNKTQDIFECFLSRGNIILFCFFLFCVGLIVCFDMTKILGNNTLGILEC